ncbi:MAG: AraC family transcriptional regulator [Bacteroidota bacterium]
MVDFFVPFYLFAFGQGVFMAVIIFLKDRWQLKNVFLSLLLVSISLQLLSYGVAYGKLVPRYPHLWSLGNGFFFLIAPSLYFFMKSKLGKAPKPRPIHLLHLIPFLAYFLYHRSFFFLSAEQKIERWNSMGGVIPFKVTEGFLIFSALGIATLILYWFMIYRLSDERSFAKQPIVFKETLVLFSGYILVYVIYKSSLLLGGDYYKLICHSTKAAMGVTIYLISYRAFFTRTKPTEKKEGYTKVLLNESVSNDLLKKLNDLFEKEQIFREGELKLSAMAERLGCSSHELSQLINGTFKTNFPTFINQKRIDYAKSLLQKDPELKIEYLAYDSGFNNRVSFNTAFKKHVGVTASAYAESFKTASEA